MRRRISFGFAMTLALAVALAGCGGGGGTGPRDFAYAVHEGGQVSIFSINSSGALLAASGDSTDSGISARALAADPSGRFLYAAQSGPPATVSAYSIDARTGALSQVGGPVETDNNPVRIAVDPTGHFLAVGCMYSLNLFSRDTTNGTLGDRASFSFVTGQELKSICFDQTGRFLYVGVDTGYIYVYGKDTEANTFSQVGAACPTSVNPSSMAFNPNGDRLFVSTTGITTMPIHPVNGDGSLGAYTSLNLHAASSSLIIDGNCLYIAKSTGVLLYSIADLASISEVGTEITLNNDGTVDDEIDTDDIHPNSLVFAPSKKFIYVTGWDSRNIWCFIRDSADGSLTVSAESPVVAEGNITAIVTVRTNG